MNLSEPRFPSGQLVRLRKHGGGTRNLHYRVFGAEQRAAGWLYHLEATEGGRRRTAYEDNLLSVDEPSAPDTITSRVAPDQRPQVG